MAVDPALAFNRMKEDFNVLQQSVQRDDFATVTKTFEALNTRTWPADLPESMVGWWERWMQAVVGCVYERCLLDAADGAAGKALLRRLYDGLLARCSRRNTHLVLSAIAKFLEVPVSSTLAYTTGHPLINCTAIPNHYGPRGRHAAFQSDAEPFVLAETLQPSTPYDRRPSLSYRSGTSEPRIQADGWVSTSFGSSFRDG